jgi:hypothetical protein
LILLKSPEGVITKKSLPAGAPLATSPLFRVVVEMSHVPAGLTDVTVPTDKVPVGAMIVICELPSVSLGLTIEAKV